MINEIIFSSEHVKERDFQFGYNQITSCLSTDLILFNLNKISARFSRVYLYFWAYSRTPNESPELFCRVMIKLGQEGFNFQLSLLDEVYGQVPETC